MCFVIYLLSSFASDTFLERGYSIPTIISKNPVKQTIGATTILRVLKISGSNPPSTLDEGPVIKMNPMIIRSTDAAQIT
jgi:hypothetical protein